MGLDIIAAANLTRIENPRFNEDDELVNEGGHIISTDLYLRLYPNSDFPAQADGMECGCYWIDPGFGKTMHIPAGSYSSYGRWRNELAKLAGWDSAEHAWRSEPSGPFYELIHFSDCEGIIGPNTSAKLRGDFGTHHKRAMVELPDDFRGFYRHLYGEFLEAFRLASQGGAVQFR